MPCNYFSVFKQIDFLAFGIYGYGIRITGACSIKSSFPNHTWKGFYKSYTFNSSPLNADWILRSTIMPCNKCDFHYFALYVYSMKNSRIMQVKSGAHISRKNVPSSKKWLRCK